MGAAAREVAESVMPLVLENKHYGDDKILEQTQNSMRVSWSREDVDQRLKQIMLGIHSQCVEHGTNGSSGANYVRGANRAGFVKVAEAMLAYGVVSGESEGFSLTPHWVIAIRARRQRCVIAG